MNIRFFGGHPASALRKFAAVCVLICSLFFTHLPNGSAAPKRVAVLYFEDHSRFDDPTGCGCLPAIGPLGKIFGGRKKNKWQLAEGFRDMLNQKLAATQVYEPVTQDELMDAMALHGISRKDFKKESRRETLAKALKVDALIIGDIRNFNQERVRANASRLMREGGGAEGTQSSFVGGVEVLGHLFIASISLNMAFYGPTGRELDTPEVSVSKRHQLGGAKVAALEAVVTEEGTEFRFGQTPRDDKTFRPVVQPTKLNEIAFGSPEYDKTLLGLATHEALAKVILALRENIGPELPPPDAARQGAPSETGVPSTSVDGKIARVDTEAPDQTYINIGEDQGLAVGQKLHVLKEEPLLDPDSGELLEVIYTPIGVVEVVQVLGRASRVRVLEGLEQIKTGDRVRDF